MPCLMTGTLHFLLLAEPVEQEGTLMRSSSYCEGHYLMATTFRVSWYGLASQDHKSLPLLEVLAMELLHVFLQGETEGQLHCAFLGNGGTLQRVLVRSDWSCYPNS